MPRVSDAHLTARREQILDAARRCFARNGFQATSMQDVISEAGLSVGAVYRYFKSKDELRVAVAETTVRAIVGEVSTVAEHEPALSPAEAVVQVVTLLEPRVVGPDSVARVAIQAWAEALRDPSFAGFVAETYTAIRESFVTIARRAQQAGHLSPDADPVAVGSTLFAIVPGYVLQRTLIGHPDQATIITGLRTVLPS